MLDDGTLDNFFGYLGLVTPAFYAENNIARSLAIQRDGQIVLAGERQNGANTVFIVARFFGTNGLPDYSFGIEGIATIASVGNAGAYASALVQDPINSVIDQLVVAGYDKKHY